MESDTSIGRRCKRNFRTVLRPGRLLLTLGLSLVTLISVTPVGGAHPGHYTCFGRTATQHGTVGPDTIVGTNGDDVLVGLGGSDTIKGWGGRDRICGNGNDVITAEVLMGGRGIDLISGGEGEDTINGEKGSDAIRGGRAADEIRGAFDNDSVWGGKGIDSLYGFEGHDTLRGVPATTMSPGSRTAISLSEMLATT